MSPSFFVRWSCRLVSWAQYDESRGSCAWTGAGAAGAGGVTCVAKEGAVVLGWANPAPTTLGALTFTLVVDDFLAMFQ
jgi:hypothetical protein